LESGIMLGELVIFYNSLSEAYCPQFKGLNVISEPILLTQQEYKLMKVC
jgi:hypothetical protein